MSRTPSNEQGVSIASGLSGEEKEKMLFLLNGGYVKINEVRLVTFRSLLQWPTYCRTTQQRGVRS